MGNSSDMACIWEAELRISSTSAAGSGSRATAIMATTGLQRVHEAPLKVRLKFPCVHFLQSRWETAQMREVDDAAAGVFCCQLRLQQLRVNEETSSFGLQHVNRLVQPTPR